MDSAILSLAASTLSSLLLIFAVLFGAAYLLRRFRGTPWRARTQAPSAIQLIATRPLGSQNSLVIVQVESQRFLIGISRSGMTAIGKLASDA
jgi:flagellar biosynthetic protein FliO